MNIGLNVEDEMDSEAAVYRPVPDCRILAFISLFWCIMCGFFAFRESKRVEKYNLRRDRKQARCFLIKTIVFIAMAFVGFVLILFVLFGMNLMIDLIRSRRHGNDISASKIG
jgi:hypothetical protein